MDDKMETARNPWWKSVLWFLGSLVYGAGATLLIFRLSFGEMYGPILRFLRGVLGHDMRGSSLDYFVLFVLAGLWVALLAIPGWQLIVHKHKLAGWLLVVMAVIAVWISVRALTGGSIMSTSGFRQVPLP